MSTVDYQQNCRTRVLVRGGEISRMMMIFRNVVEFMWSKIYINKRLVDDTQSLCFSGRIAHVAGRGRWQRTIVREVLYMEFERLINHSDVARTPSQHRFLWTRRQDPSYYRKTLSIIILLSFLASRIESSPNKETSMSESSLLVQ